MNTAATRLWEADHDYYCDAGGSQFRYASWEEFHDEWGDSDMALDMVVRWDWWLGVDENGDEGYYEYDEVTVTFLQGRRGRVVDARFRVEIKDRERVEPLFRTWLEPRWAFLKSEWEPISQEGPTPEPAEAP